MIYLVKKVEEKIISVVIINTGGTFNKKYDEITGALEVQKDNFYVEEILSVSKITQKDIFGILYKDSLEINDSDREKLTQLIHSFKEKKVLIVHGTDTIDITAKYLFNQIKDKTIVLTGAMKPYSIDPVEATSNFMLGFGYLQGCETNGVYIAMHGNVRIYTEIKKNKKKGIFECLS